MTKWYPKLQFPSDSDYINRVVEAVFAPSNSGNPMITLTYELVAPETKFVAGEEIMLSSVKTKGWFVTGVNDDMEKTANCQTRIKELYEKFGLPADTLDFNNLDVSVFKGKLFYAMMSADIEVMRREPTPAQIAEAKRTGKEPEGDVMINPLTKQKLIQYWPKVREIFGLVPEAEASKYPY